MIQNKLCLARLGLLLWLPLQVLAQENISNLERIAQKVQEQDGLIANLAQQIEKTQSDKGKLEKNFKELRSQEQQSRQALELLQREFNALQSEIEHAEKELQRVRELWLSRLRALYVYQDSSLWESVVLTKEQDLGANLVYLRYLRQFDQALSERLQVGLEQQAKRKAELADLLGAKQKLLGKIAAERALREKQLSELNTLNKNLKEQQAGLQKELAELKAQALRLETVLVSMTSPDQAEQKPRKLASSKSTQQQEQFHGPGLFRQKGSLSLPVVGKISQAYGKRKVKQFSDLVMSKGIEYQAAEGSNVIAISAGKLIYLGRMPAYGTVAILDHGERYYSLYGRLEHVKIEKGELLEKGQVIGQVGAINQTGSNFYFEIRRNGSPVNPQDYFRKLE